MFATLKIIIPLGVGIYLLWYLYTAMDIPTKTVFFQAIKQANYYWILLSLVLGIFSHIIRAHRWKYMLEPMGYSSKLSHRFYAVMSGYLVNLIIPRAGEVSRAALLYRSDNIPFSKSFGTILAERIFDTIILGIVVFVALLLSFEDLNSIKALVISNAPEDGETQNARWILMSILFLFTIGVGLFIFLWLKRERFKKKVNAFIQELIKGFLAIFKSKKPYHFLFYTFLIWVLYISFFGVCFYAFDETKDFPLSGILIGFIAGTIGIAFTNGGIGAYPYLVGIVVSFYLGDSLTKVEHAEGIGKAVGIIIWLSQTIMVIVVGLISFMLLPKKYKKNDEVGANSI